MDASSPLVSIVIPVFNGEAYIHEALESVFAQTHRPIELIVVDDGSTDGSAHAISKFRDIRYFDQPNQSVAAARNYGIRQAKGSLLAFLDQDDLWMPEKLERQVEFLRTHQETGIVSCHSDLFVEPGTSLPVNIRRTEAEHHHTLFPSALVIRKTAFELVGNFDTRFTYSSDSEWLVRATAAGIRSGVVEETLVKKRYHKQNESYHVEQNEKELLLIAKESLERKRSGKS